MPWEQESSIELTLVLWVLLDFSVREDGLGGGRFHGGAVIFLRSFDNYSSRASMVSSFSVFKLTSHMFYSHSAVTDFEFGSMLFD